MYGVIRYGYGKDKPVAPTYERVTSKGNTCKVYICSEWDCESIGYVPIGYNYKVIWYSYGDMFFHTEEVNDITDTKSVDDVIDEFMEKYGHGRMYVLQDEIVTR